MRSHVYLLLAPLASAEIPVVSQLFQLTSGHAPNNLKLSWSRVDGATNYTVYRKRGSSDLVPVANSPGNGVDIYDINDDDTYQVQASNEATRELDTSGTIYVHPGTSSDSSQAKKLSTYDNTVKTKLNIKSKIQIGSTYYQYIYTTDTHGFSHFVEQTSSDGYTFSGSTKVLTRETVCASVADGYCKLESIKWAQHPKTKEAIMWAHFENTKDYKLAKVAGASGMPGSGKQFAFSGAFRPTGDDSRDLTFFADSDGKGYIISAIHTNSDLGLYALDDNWHNVTSKVATLQKGEKREAPAMVHVDGFYYLLTSTANGWYPSEGKYISSKSLTGPWSGSRNIGNAAGFGAQSGQIEQIGDTHVQAANRWAHQWAKPEPDNRQIILPMAFGNGWAQYFFYRTLQYSDDSGVVVPVQDGRILSVGKRATASNGKNPHEAADGIHTDPKNLFTPSATPFWWQVDLGGLHEITQVDVTPKVVGGSDTYLQYQVMASPDGKSWKTIADESKNTAVGFRTNDINDNGKYRYVKINVEKVIKIKDGAEASWAAGLHEVLVYGN